MLELFLHLLVCVSASIRSSPADRKGDEERRGLQAEVMVLNASKKTDVVAPEYVRRWIYQHGNDIILVENWSFSQCADKCSLSENGAARRNTLIFPYHL